MLLEIYSYLCAVRKMRGLSNSFGQPPDFYKKAGIMDVKSINEAMAGAIEARGCFLVETIVSKDNDVEIVIESVEGTVSLDDCAELSRHFESLFDREKEDYSLTVASAGLDQPFKVIGQFRKAVGSRVEVSLKGGRRLTGELTGADEERIILKYTAKEAVEGRKRKELVEHEDAFPMDTVTSVVPYIEFEQCE